MAQALQGCLFASLLARRDGRPLLGLYHVYIGSSLLLAHKQHQLCAHVLCCGQLGDWHAVAKQAYPYRAGLCCLLGGMCTTL
jgi:hypothetical protein